MLLHITYKNSENKYYIFHLISFILLLSLILQIYIHISHIFKQFKFLFFDRFNF
jgi:hypothetical protein